MMGVGVIGLITTILFGHGNVPVGIYGARPYLIHFPLIFVIGAILSREDVEKVGKVMLYVTIGMIVVIGLQFNSPQSAWINRGIGGDVEGSGFSGALGFYRPSGTFSFSNGITLFFSMASSFILYFWLRPKGVNKIVLIGATLALMASIPLSISRGLFFSIGVTVIFALMAAALNPKLLGKIIFGGVAFSIAVLLLSFTSTFQNAVGALANRFDTASVSEGGVEGTLVDRYLGGLLRAFSFNESLPMFGHGFGILSNVGTMLLSGKVVAGVSEGEWGRGIYEVGALLGIIIIVLRVGLSVSMFGRSLRKLREGDILPWLLLCFFLLNVPQGNWGQPTGLGFCVVIGGLLMASLKKPRPVVPDNQLINNKSVKF